MNRAKSGCVPRDPTTLFHHSFPAAELKHLRLGLLPQLRGARGDVIISKDRSACEMRYGKRAVMRPPISQKVRVLASLVKLYGVKKDFKFDFGLI